MARGEQTQPGASPVCCRLGVALMGLMLVAVGIASVGAGEAAGPAPIDFARPGTHKEGRWEYRYEFSYDRERKPIGFWGYLYRDGNLVEGKLEEEMHTPWGTLYYVGVPQMVNGPHGWLPLPRELVTRESLLMRSDEIACALERAKAVRERLKRFTFGIQYGNCWGSSTPPFNSLTLRTWSQREQRRPDWPAVQVTPEKAMQLLDLLVRSGFLARAIDLTDGQRPGIKGPCYMFLLTTHDEKHSFVYRENLGWNLTTIRRIGSLASVLDTDELAGPLNVLLAKLEPYRKEWEKAATDPAYVKARATEVEKQIVAYYQALRATRKLQRETWWDGNRELMPLLVPHLIASSDADVQHQALLMARDHYGRRELVPHIIRALGGLLNEPKDSAGFTRILACEVLAEWPDLRSVPVLLKALADSYTYHGLVGDEEHTEHVYRAVWWEADRALRLITWANPTAKPLTHVMPRLGQREAAQTAWETWWRENKDRLLKSPTPPWEKGDRTEFDWQLARLEHMHPWTRADAVKAIGRLGGDRALKTLIELLGDEEYSVHTEAGVALVRLGPSGAERLLAALKHDSPRTRKAAAATLHELKDPRAVPPLVETLKDTDPIVRSAAAYSLLHMGDKRAIEPFIAALKDDEVWARRYVAEGLATFGDSRAVGPLIAALTDKDLKVRTRAADGLGRLGDRRAGDPLIRALQDTHNEVRQAAATALGALGEPRAVAPLLAALKDKHPSVRCASATALGKLGDRLAAQPLKALLQDEYDYVRRAAAEALKRIQAADPPVPPAPGARSDPVRRARIACLRSARPLRNPFRSPPGASSTLALAWLPCCRGGPKRYDGP